MVDSPRHQPGRPENPFRRGRRRWRPELYGISARYEWGASGAHRRGTRPSHLARWKMGDHETGEGRTLEPGADGSRRAKAAHARCRKLWRGAMVTGREAAAGFGD